MLISRIASLIAVCCLAVGLVGCNSKAQFAPTGTVKALTNTQPVTNVDKP
ncbi:MAG: hypothetical protein QM703_17965 [Gemmatales bacterium]